MGRMTDSSDVPDPDAAPAAPGASAAPATPAAPGDRRLDRPPSERYRPAAAADAPPARSASSDRASPARGVAFGGLAALLGAAAIVLFGGAMAVSAGLLVVAAAIGYAVGLATVVGAAGTLPDGARPWIAAALAALSVILGQVGLWLFARAEGGVLPPIDYLGQTFGPLVPIELMVAAGVAWWRAR